jgi:opacity protein-like surface antigen
MKKTLTAVVACAAFLAPAALADVNGSIQKLSNDAASYHGVLVADAQHLMADVQSLTGSKDKAAAKTLLTADLQKVKTDMQAAHQALEADRGRLQADVQALKGTKPSKAGAQALRQSLQQLRASVQAERQDVKSSNDAARQAL